MMNENRAQYYLLKSVSLLYDLDQELAEEIAELTQRANPTTPNEAQGEADQARLAFLRKFQNRIRNKLNFEVKRLTQSSKS